MISDWTSFWDTPHGIYVNARHKDVHYRLIAEQIAALLPCRESCRQARVLDCGSGEALHADAVAAAAGEVLLCEVAPGVRAGLKARFAGNPRIKIFAPGEVAALAEHSLDLVVLHSVVQYLTPEEAGPLFALFHKLLKSDGVLIVSDVIAPNSAALTRAASLLRFAAANRFVIAALIGLVRIFVSDYRRLRARFGITRYGEAAMIEKLAAAGFSARSAPQIIGHDKARLAFIARPAIAGSTS